MPWNALSSVAQHLVVHPYAPPAHADDVILPLAVGTRLHAIEQYSPPDAVAPTWYRGYAVADPDMLTLGVFPACCVVEIPSSVAQSITASAGQSPPLPVQLFSIDDTPSLPIINHIAAAIRTYARTLEHLVHQQQYPAAVTLAADIHSLFQHRARLLRLPPSSEISTRMPQIANKLSQINRAHSLDNIVIDHSNGSCADLTTGKGSTSFPSLLQSHWNNLQQTDHSTQDKQSAAVSKTQLHQLQLAIHSINVNSNVETSDLLELNLSLYSATESRFISEEFCVVTDGVGTLVDGTMETVFKDILNAELDSLFLVAKISTNGIPTPSSSSTAHSTLPYRNPKSAASDISFKAGSITNTINSMHTIFDAPQHFNSMVDDSADAGRQTVRQPLACAVIKIDTSFAARREVTLALIQPRDPATFSILHEELLTSGNRASASIGTLSLAFKVEAQCQSSKHTTARLGIASVGPSTEKRNDLYIKLWRGHFQSQSTSARSFSSRFSTSNILQNASNINARNVEVAVELRTAYSTSSPNYKLGRGSGAKLVSQFNSVVFKGNSAPSWGELIKASLQPSRLLECHLLFLFRHRSFKERNPASAKSLVIDKPFAFAYMPLSTTFEEGANPDMVFPIQDGLHRLIVYRYDQQVVQPPLYLKAPASVPNLVSNSALPKSLIPLKDCEISVRTFLCSTTLTANPTLLALFQQRETKEVVQMMETVKQIRNVQEVEIVKFLPQTLDALFTIIDKDAPSTTPELAAALLTSLTFIALIPQDRRYTTIQTAIDDYIRHKLRSQYAHTYLLDAIANILQAEPVSESCRNCIKAWDVLFAFIFQCHQHSRIKQRELGQNLTLSLLEQRFQDLATKLMDIIKQVLRSSDAKLVGTRTLITQNVFGILDRMYMTFGAQFGQNQIIEIGNALEKAEGGRLNIAKITLLDRIVSNHLAFKLSHARVVIIPDLVRWIQSTLDAVHSHISHSSENNLIILRISTAVIAHLLEKLQHFDLDADDAESLEYLLSLLPIFSKIVIVLPAALPANSSSVCPPLQVFSSSPMSHLSNVDHNLLMAKSEISTTIVMLLGIAKPNGIKTFLDTVVSIQGVRALSEIVRTLCQAVSTTLSYQEPISNFINLNIITIRTFLNSFLVPAFPLLQIHLLPPPSSSTKFDTQAWRSYLIALFQLIDDSNLAIETFSPQKRKVVRELAGDSREAGAQLLWNAWTSLSWAHSKSKLSHGGYQVQFLDMMDAVVKLAFSLHNAIRGTAVRVLHSMILSCYRLSGNFASIQARFIDSLDRILSNQLLQLDNSPSFVQELHEMFGTPAEPLAHNDPSNLLDTVQTFLDLLIDIQNLQDGEEWQDERVSKTLKIMSFVHDSPEQRRVFLRYCHRLNKWHEQSENWIESAMTFKMHADLYTYNHDTRLDAIEDLDLQQQSEFARKEYLLRQAADRFSKGQDYDNAIRILKELQIQYENANDFKQLHDCLHLQAEAYLKWQDVQFHIWPYFWVVFRGQGLPASIQDQTFVYQGLLGEDLAQFSKRLHAMHTTATISLHDDEELPEHQNAITIGTCLPIMPNRSSPSTLRTYAQFQYTLQPRQRKSSTSSSYHTWSEKITLTCEESLPSVISRSRVKQQDSARISPIEVAVEDLQLMNHRLKQFNQGYQRLERQETADLTHLSVALNQCIDVPAGQDMTSLRSTFTKTKLDDYQLQFAAAFEMVAEEHIALVRKGLELHKSLSDESMKPYHQNLERLFVQNFSETVDRRESRGHANGTLSPLSPIFESDLFRNENRSIEQDSTTKSKRISTIYSEDDFEVRPTSPLSINGRHPMQMSRKSSLSRTWSLRKKR